MNVTIYVEPYHADRRQIFEVMDYQIHPNFRTETTTRNDIALLERGNAYFWLLTPTWRLLGDNIFCPDFHLRYVFLRKSKYFPQ